MKPDAPVRRTCDASKRTRRERDGELRAEDDGHSRAMGSLTFEPRVGTDELDMAGERMKGGFGWMWMGGWGEWVLGC